MNPFNKIDELCELCGAWSTQVKYQSDEGYNWLEDWARCIVVNNPYSDNNIEVKIEDGCEFILFFAGGHCHYYPDDEEFLRLRTDLTNLLNNSICAAAIFYGENHCLGETYVKKEDLDLPYTEVFSFVLRHKEFSDQLYLQGGVVEYRFWNPKDDKTIRIEKTKRLLHE